MVYDLLAFASFSVLIAGLWLCHPAMALIVGGTLLLAAACTGSANARRDRLLKQFGTRRKRK